MHISPRSMGILIRCLLSGVFAAAQFPPPLALAAIEIGTTVKVVNQVRAKTLNRRLKLGDDVVYRETVSTGRASAVDILLIDQSTLVMGERSEMILDSLVYDPNRGVVEGVIEAVEGILRFTSSGVKMDLTIDTPFSTIGVRGTMFDVLTRLAAMVISVHVGAVQVTSAAGTEDVSRGQGYRVTAEGAAGFQADTSPEMKQAVSTMLALIADEGEGAAAAESGGAETAAVPGASIAFKKAITGKNPEDLIYLDLAGGRMVIELRPDLAPGHVSRIKDLARRGFYDGLGFHFVRRGYVAEAGDPTGTGAGDSGHTLEAEFSDVPVERGVVGMSRARNDPDSADSQFFISLGRAPHLDGKYTVIGRVILGMELADLLQAGKPPKNPDMIVKFRVGADVKN